ncbi:RagB/SusD family nutrient uptake outer membrane protein [Niabella sp.]|uniref:RagB/SusD family nutrient uptake outer membrane protein n=1 Tax=Niabella sp. TaxID=1962976 RepID=UPI00261744B1|nr:RagB/SusD family nutrient uptake outer membrane protein [Niabella sp.]
MKNRIILYIAVAILGFTSSCKKSFLDVTPESYINSEQLGKSSAATMGTLRGIYAGLRSYGLTGYAGHEDYGHKSILSVLDLMGNDVVMLYPNWNMYNYNYTGRVSTNSRAHMPWFTYYMQIKNTNTIINNVDENTEDAELRHVRGQALALRGYFHFMLARIYGPTYKGHENALCIPLNIDTTSLIRKKVSEVYAQIEQDLEKAVVALEGYTRPNKEMVDQGVAQAFLADVYLEMGKYAQAADMAHKARQGYSLLTESQWKNGFYDINQNETMWGADINAELTTFVASFFSHFDNTNTGYAEGGSISIDRRLYDAMSSTDFRKSSYFGADGGEYDGTEYDPYISLKFRDLTMPDRTDGDYIYLRSAAMYYIEAEGLARSGKESEARDALYEITKQRDPEYLKSTKSGDALIDEIILQKRIELWGEGFAWFDLKRLGKGVVRNYAGSNHPSWGNLNIPAGDNKFLFMIPQAEVDANPAVLPNNPQ